MRRWSTALLALLTLSCAGSTHPRRQAARVPVAAASVAAAPWHLDLGFGPDWPRIRVGVESRYFSSFDRTGRNADGFDGRHATLYTLASGEHVIFDALGPGVLRTLWFTGPREGGEGLDLGAIRFYFDGEARPRIETDLRRLFGGSQEPFVKPLVADNHVSTGGFVSWVPLPYARRLIITTSRRPSFYIAQYDTYPVDSRTQSWSPGMDLSTAAELFRQAARAPTPDASLGQVKLDHRQGGAGTLRRIQLRLHARSGGAPLGCGAERTRSCEPDPEALRRARVQLWWEDGARPAIDLPLGLFFGSGLGVTSIRSMAFGMICHRHRCVFENRLPMPFVDGFHIRVSGIEGELWLDLGPPPPDRDTVGLLHAVFQDADPTRPGHDFEWVDMAGAGKLVGTILTVIPPTPETKRWWEGDLRSYADGRRTPGLHGTGHEDDHLGGWSNTFLTGPFTLPMHGEPATEVIERQGEQYNARTTMYRLWPGISFVGGIRHSVEHGSENRIQAHYSGVAWLYLQRGPRLVQTDGVVLGDADSRAQQQQHHLVVDGPSDSETLTSRFEGRAYQVPVQATVLAHAGPVRFALSTVPDNPTPKLENVGCLLRRMFDQRRGRQRAAVWIDGQYVADWYVAEANAVLRWAERDLFLPARFTRGRPRLQVELRPAVGAPPWTAAAYTLLCVSPAARSRAAR